MHLCWLVNLLSMIPKSILWVENILEEVKVGKCIKARLGCIWGRSARFWVHCLDDTCIDSFYDGGLFMFCRRASRSVSELGRNKSRPSKTNKSGILGSKPMPEVLRFFKIYVLVYKSFIIKRIERKIWIWWFMGSWSKVRLSQLATFL